MFKGMTIFEFHEKFKDDNDCLKYLADLRWANGFSCDRCKSNEYGKGNEELHRRCKGCGANYSPTSGTMFHKVKFSLRKAFYICYRVTVSKKGMASTELSREINLRQKTVWAFKRKVQEAMKSSEQYPLKGNIEVDEFVIGGPEKGKPGRSKGSKRIVALAVEKPGDGLIGRAYGLQIQNYSSEEIGKLLNKHVDKDATIVADGWSAYDKLSQQWNIDLQESGKGANYVELHTVIMNFKSWLRGIYHKCSTDHTQAYLNEYFYRFNRRSFNETAFERFVARMIEHPPMYQKQFSA
jgi:transposase-like protein